MIENATITKRMQQIADHLRSHDGEIEIVETYRKRQFWDEFLFVYPEFGKKVSKPMIKRLIAAGLIKLDKSYRDPERDNAHIASYRVVSSEAIHALEGKG